MWYAIGSLVIIILILYFGNSYRAEIAIQREGGVTRKYVKLILLLKENRSQMIVIKETWSYLVLGFISNGKAGVFEFFSTYSNITIVYSQENVNSRSKLLKWKFSANGDQEYMAFKINKDIDLFLSKNKK